MLTDKVSKARMERLGREFSVANKRVLVADGPVLSAVAALLQDSFDVVGMFSDGHAALEVTLRLKPDLVVMNILIPNMSGIEVATVLKVRAPKTKLVFLIVHKDSDIAATCL
jgi:DNA-binding NarL/FixJ family response regulator